MSDTITFKTAEEYIKMQPDATKARLIELMECILKAVPDAAEMINYNIIAYALIPGGKRDQQVMIAGYRKHVGLYPGADTMEHFSERLKHYKQGKGSVQFPLNQPLPKDLITEMVKYKEKRILDSVNK